MHVGDSADDAIGFLPEFLVQGSLPILIVSGSRVPDDSDDDGDDGA